MEAIREIREETSVSNSNGSGPSADAVRALEQLEQTQRLTRTGCWEWRIDTDEVFWSAELYRIFDLEPQRFEASYAGVLAHVHLADRARVHKAIEAALKSGGQFEFDHRIVRHDGEVRTVHCNGEVVLEDARAVRAFGTCQDVTERTRIEREVALANELALGISTAATVEEALEMVLSRICEETGFTLGQAWAPAEGCAYLEVSAAWPAEGG